VPDNRQAPDGYERLAASMGRDRAEQSATDARLGHRAGQVGEA